MYDEFERAVTGKGGEKLSFLAWMSIAMGTIFVLFLIGAALAAVKVKDTVVETIEVIEQELEARPTVAAEAMLARLESHADLLNIPPEEGASLLQDLGDGAPSEAFMEDFFGGSLGLLRHLQVHSEILCDAAKDALRSGQIIPTRAYLSLGILDFLIGQQSIRRVG